MHFLCSDLFLYLLFGWSYHGIIFAVPFFRIVKIDLFPDLWQARLKDFEAVLSRSPKDPDALEVSHWLSCRIPVLFLCYHMLLIEMYLWSLDCVKYVFGAVHVIDKLLNLKLKV